MGTWQTPKSDSTAAQPYVAYIETGSLDTENVINFEIGTDASGNLVDLNLYQPIPSSFSSYLNSANMNGSGVVFNIPANNSTNYYRFVEPSGKTTNYFVDNVEIRIQFIDGGTAMFDVAWMAQTANVSQSGWQPNSRYILQICGPIAWAWNLEI